MNSARRHLSAPTSPRATGLAACVVLALTLNVGVVGIATGTSSTQHGGVSKRDNATAGTMTLVSAPSRSTAPPRSLEAAPGDTASNAPTPKPTNLPSASTTASSTLPPQQIVFYAFHEVDNPAFPESDWNLDAETLDAIGAQRLAFEVLISARGEVVGCTVLSPADLADDVKRDLERRISATRLLPAEREGQPVASTRRIELALAVEPLDVPFASAAHRP
jgi:hypothetical protein